MQTKYIIAILLVVTLFLLSLMMINYNLLRSHSFSGAKDTAELIRSNADKQLTQVFQELEYLTRSLADYRVVKDIDEEKMKELFVSTVLVRRSYLRSIYLGTEDGRMYEWGIGDGFTDHTPVLAPDYDPRNRPWYRAALEVDGYALTNPYIYASFAVLGITAGVPVRDDEGRIIGVLGIDIILKGLQNVANSIEIQKQGRLLLLTPSGKILASQFHPYEQHPRELRQFEYPELLADNQIPSVAVIYDNQFLINRKRNEATGWWIFLALPYDEIMAFSLENLKLIVAFDILLALILGVLITLITRRILTAPLERIMHTMMRMELGENGVRMPSSDSHEFAVIGRLFNRLADLREESSRKMEDKVKARTQAVMRLQQENLRLRIIEEKETIYGNLHDSLGARLTGINISNNVAKTALQQGDAQITTQMLSRIEQNTQQAIQDLKVILLADEESEETRKGSGQSDKLVDYLENTLRTRLNLKEIDFESNLPPVRDMDELHHSLISDIEKLVQEIASNLIKHSQAEKVNLVMKITSKGLQLLVKDDGVGFNLREELRNGFGIQGLFNRAERMGGLLKINTKPGKGTQIELLVKPEESA